MRRIDPITPGEMLQEEFLKPLGITQYRLAKEIGVPPGRISEIVSGQRAITADTDLRLCKYFGLSEGWWLRGQARLDIEIAKRALQKELEKIKLCSALAT
jgi:addiction module HigA family antidote